MCVYVQEDDTSDDDAEDASGDSDDEDDEEEADEDDEDDDSEDGGKPAPLLPVSCLSKHLSACIQAGVLALMHPSIVCRARCGIPCCKQRRRVLAKARGLTTAAACVDGMAHAADEDDKAACERVQAQASACLASLGSKYGDAVRTAAESALGVAPGSTGRMSGMLHASLAVNGYVA